ncbi:gamma-glutamylcyclotransferase [Pseudomaricurvus alkylphenolicus]|jgi:gamma-glutamylcyclotransferase (GGCT)/AIG2-like uncharacterized protein YtfP|uniref:gamma-glutamylcyclotransferase family protein n=1 Tax=Pseudomaricurvus alkylphenolicus TaxID=1306991 RepID=UPI00141E38BB|nr:gamma-glutamylcyclotransferase family protein [Pseudomaricurvus alkylphenolicus]NIB42604.1 gamma-glutamylcyclotransferase [Pseudomaricurvus alkylphenolicus]
MLVAVYGSLKKHYFNHDILQEAEFIGNWLTEPDYTMIDLGGFPGVIQGGSCAIDTEIYRVSTRILRTLDDLEGHPNVYRRVALDSPYGEVEMYLYQNKNEASFERLRAKTISSGKWVEEEFAPWASGRKFLFACQDCGSTAHVQLESINDLVTCQCGSEMIRRGRPHCA